MSVDQILILTLTLTLVGLIMILHIVDHQILVKRRRQRKQEIQAYLLQKLQVGEDIRKRYPKRQLYEAYVELVQSIDLSSERKYDAYRLFVSMGLIQRELRRLRSFRSTVRMRAISFLSTFPEKYIVNTLLGMLSTETNERAKTLLAYAVRHRIDDTTLPQLIHSLIGSKRFYQYRMIQMLIRYMPVTLLHMDQYFDRPEIEIKEVFVDLSRKVYHPIFEPLLWKNLKMLEAHLDGHVAQEFVHVQPFRLHRLHKSIMLALSEQFGAVFSDDSHLYHPQPEIVEIAVSTIARSGGSATIEKLMRAASHAASTLPFSDGILRMTEKNQLLYDGLIEWLGKDLSRTDKQVLTRVFRARLNYVLLKLTTRNPIWLDRLIELMMAEGSRTELINFLNMNKDLDLEKRLTKILAEYARTDEELLFELSTYLSSEVYARMGFLKLTLVPQKRKTAKNEISKTKWLIRHLIFSIVFLPLLFVLIRWRIVFLSPILASAEQYVIFINKVFIGYYLAVNAIYFMLAMLSYFANRRQSALWRLKGHPLLYEPGMIPSVTIIAPAYNEAMSIVDNIHSLLNLDYPDYQVVIVNDGSKDNTLQTVIDHFEMIRVDIPKVASIETRPVKAVYANKSYPNLLMVDKENGGKADALNVGINYATKEYVCGIDADSLLEPDALLRLMSSMLDHDKITIALGGSIIPVNGSMVDKGHIERFGLAKNGLARLQTVEYLRAFNLSRLGFSELHSLLIISGAFGLFEKRILIESGGYLTVSSLKKDTVGEDMELVVRVTRKALETNLNYRVDFIAKAHCHTEVPQSIKTFFRQRNRWQRGLVDILSYHRKMIMNPKYKQVGLFAMSYFYVFEMIGPLFEVQAYLAIFAGIFFGILNTEILLLLFVVTVLLGIVLSLFSLMISEDEHEQYSVKEIWVMIGIAILENFGWRQLISLQRAYGFLLSLRENQAWGQMNRVGFRQGNKK